MKQSDVRNYIFLILILKHIKLPVYDHSYS